VRFTGEDVVEWSAYFLVVGLILAWLPANAVAKAETAPEAQGITLQQFEPSDALVAEILAVSLPTEVEFIDFSVVEEHPIEQYRNRTEPLTSEELRYLLEMVGFEGEALQSAWAVVMSESTGNPLSHNTNARTRDNSYGLFQINMYGTLEAYRRSQFDLPSNEALFDPVLNAEIAFIISKGGTDFGDWRVGPNAYRGGGSPPGYDQWLPKYPEES